MKKDNEYKSNSFDNEFKMIVLNRMCSKMNLMNFNGKTSPIEIENTIYVSNGKTLSEKEKIFYECGRIDSSSDFCRYEQEAFYDGIIDIYSRNSLE